MRLEQFLTEHDIAFETLVHPPAYTAQKLAKYLGISGKRVAKAVLLIGESGPFLAVLPATHSIDTESLRHQLNEPVRLASEKEIAEVFWDCEWGVVSPFGKLYWLPTLLDRSFEDATILVFEAQSHMEAIRMKCQDYAQLEQPRRLDFARKFEAARSQIEESGAT